MKSLSLEHIATGCGTQSRAVLHKEVIDQYAEAMNSGATLPPLEVFSDGTAFWLADGFHRYRAAKKLGRNDLPCNVHKGSLRDAILFSVGSNAEHGLPRTNADKHAAIMMLLNDQVWVTRSDGWIAKACRVDQRSVGRVRQQHAAFIQEETVGLDGKVRRVGGYRKRCECGAILLNGYTACLKCRPLKEKNTAAGQPTGLPAPGWESRLREMRVAKESGSEFVFHLDWLLKCLSERPQLSKLETSKLRELCVSAEAYIKQPT